MSETLKCTWTGKSGTKYIYEIYPIATEFKAVPGNYIFARESRPGYWSARYIGQTNNLNERLGDHEKEACAKRNGATHIHVHSNGNGEHARKTEEKDLILNNQPPCNDQYVS
jgi:hypothetical protein